MNPVGLVLLASILGMGLGGGKLSGYIGNKIKENPVPTPKPRTNIPFRESAIGRILTGQNPLEPIYPTLTPRPSPSPVPTSSPTPTRPPGTPTPTPRYGTLAGYTNGEIPSDFLSYINEAGDRTGVSKPLIASHLMTEGGYNKMAKNQSVLDNGAISNERGAAQISDYWWPNVTDEQAFDSRFATNFLADYLARELKRYKNPTYASASYNVGGQLGEGYGPNGLGPAGREYMNKIVRNLSPEVLQELGLLNSY